MTLLANQEGLQNVYTPLPLGIHIVFCIFATVVLLIQYSRKSRICYLLATIAVDATLITHLAFEHKAVILTLEIIELLLVAGCIIDIAIAYMKKREKMRAEKEQKNLLDRRQKEREKREVISDSDVLDRAFDSDLNNLGDGN